MRAVIFFMILLSPVFIKAQSLSKSEIANPDSLHQDLMDLIDSRQFVFRANRLRIDRGIERVVLESINYLALGDSVAVLQIEEQQEDYSDANGVGGLTVDGRFSRLRVKDKGVGKGANVRFTLFGRIPLHMTLQIFDNKYAQLLLNDFDGTRVVLFGNIVPLKGADIYIGTTNF